ncbi:hypothetical protein D3C72_2069740 [compost metagenome]
MPGQQRQLLARQPVFFQRPGAAQGAGHFAQHKAVDRLAHARRRRVGRCGHIAVVAAVVFDEKVPVGRGRQHQLGQPAFELGVFMAQLMPQVDAEPAHRAGGQHHGEHAMPGQSLRGHKPGAEDERGP